MKINQIRPGMNGINTIGKITEIGEKRLVSTRFGDAFVAKAVLEDETGKIYLNLWRDQINMVEIGDTIKIENGFSKEFRGQTELSVSSKGKITVISKNK
ncbi:MAG: DNA-binding protein [Candidatus Bathyarchaeia archaeon]|nr:DNA-binding protein [Candidatus Bathyarchaeota archaeon]